MFMRNICKVQRIYNAPLLQRLFGTNQPLAQYNKELDKFKLKQARLQCDDGLPTYLKGGARDQILFNFTRGYVIFCLFLSFLTIRALLTKIPERSFNKEVL